MKNLNLINKNNEYNGVTLEYIPEKEDDDWGIVEKIIYYYNDKGIVVLEETTNIENNESDFLHIVRRFNEFNEIIIEMIDFSEMYQEKKQIKNLYRTFKNNKIIEEEFTLTKIGWKATNIFKIFRYYDDFENKKIQLDIFTNDFVKQSNGITKRVIKYENNSPIYEELYKGEILLGGKSLL